VIGHTQLLSNGSVGLAIDKEGTQREVAAVEGLARFDKELAAEGVIHDRDSGLRVHYYNRVQLHRSAAQSHFQGVRGCGLRNALEITALSGTGAAMASREPSQTHSGKRNMTGGKSPSALQAKLRDLAEIASSKLQH
jgi:hypothetical protein